MGGKFESTGGVCQERHGVSIKIGNGVGRVKIPDGTKIRAMQIYIYKNSK